MRVGRGRSRLATPLGHEYEEVRLAVSRMQHADSNDGPSVVDGEGFAQNPLGLSWDEGVEILEASRAPQERVSDVLADVPSTDDDALVVDGVGPRGAITETPEILHLASRIEEGVNLASLSLRKPDHVTRTV